MKHHKGAGRAHIQHTPDLSCYSPGKRPARFNPAFQVKEQPKPTPDVPIRMHKRLAGGGR